MITVSNRYDRDKNPINDADFRGRRVTSQLIDGIIDRINEEV